MFTLQIVDGLEPNPQPCDFPHMFLLKPIFCFFILWLCVQRYGLQPEMCQCQNRSQFVLVCPQMFDKTDRIVREV